MHASRERRCRYVCNSAFLPSTCYEILFIILLVVILGLFFGLQFYLKIFTTLPQFILVITVEIEGVLFSLSCLAFILEFVVVKKSLDDALEHSLFTNHLVLLAICLILYGWYEVNHWCMTNGYLPTTNPFLTSAIDWIFAQIILVILVCGVLFLCVVCVNAIMDLKTRVAVSIARFEESEQLVHEKDIA